MARPFGQMAWPFGQMARPLAWPFGNWPGSNCIYAFSPATNENHPVPYRRDACAVRSCVCQAPGCQRHRPRHDHRSGTGARRQGCSLRSSSHPKSPRNRRSRRELQVRGHGKGNALSGLDGQPRRYDAPEAQRQPASARRCYRQGSGNIHQTSGRISIPSMAQRARQIVDAIFASVRR